jgi:hypothetical protein
MIMCRIYKAKGKEYSQTCVQLPSLGPEKSCHLICLLIVVGSDRLLKAGSKVDVMAVLT